MVSVLAVVAAVLVWQWRAHRGPVMVAALAIGAAAAAGVAAGVGAVLVHWRYGTVDIAGAPVSPEHRVHYVIEAPAVFFGHSPLQIAAMTILLPAASRRAGLRAHARWRRSATIWARGRRSKSRVTGPPVTAESALPSAQ